MALNLLDLILGIAFLILGVWGIVFKKQIFKTDVLAWGGSLKTSNLFAIFRILLFSIAGLFFIWRAFA